MIANPRNVWEGFLSQKKETVSFVLQVGALIQHTSVTGMHYYCMLTASAVRFKTSLCMSLSFAGCDQAWFVHLFVCCKMIKCFLRYLNVFYALVVCTVLGCSTMKWLGLKGRKRSETLQLPHCITGGHSLEPTLCSGRYVRMGVVTTARLCIRCERGSVLRHRMSWVVAVQLHSNI